MTKKIRILVTGAGSGVGQSIIKALKISKLNIDIIFGDINYFNSGLYRIKNSIIVPKVENKGALKWYIKNLKKLKINILMIGSEHDLVFFSKNTKEIQNKTGCLNYSVNIIYLTKINYPIVIFILNENHSAEI